MIVCISKARPQLQAFNSQDRLRHINKFDVRKLAKTVVDMTLEDEGNEP